MDVHAHGFQLGPPAEIRQVDHEGATDHLGPQPFDQADARFCRAAGGKKVMV